MCQGTGLSARPPRSRHLPAIALKVIDIHARHFRLRWRVPVASPERARARHYLAGIASMRSIIICIMDCIISMRFSVSLDWLIIDMPSFIIFM